ncbi:hypothetical protein ACUXV3_07000 [Roseobacteraceae bacterium NS-SX3]
MQSAFVPGRKGIAALVCSTCGAPFAAQKARPLMPGKGAKYVPAPVASPARPKRKKNKPPKPRKRRKSLFRKALSEVIDVIEDIFD